MGWLATVTPILGKLRYLDCCQFQANLGYRVKPFLKKTGQVLQIKNKVSSILIQFPSLRRANLLAVCTRGKFALFVTEKNWEHLTHQ